MFVMTRAVSSLLASDWYSTAEQGHNHGDHLYADLKSLLASLLCNDVAFTSGQGS